MRRTVLMGACLWAACGALSAGPVFTLYGTGFDNAGNLLTTAGAIDGNFTMTVNPNGSDSNAYLVDPNAYPVGGGVWVADDANSGWIGLAGAASTGVAGSYTYQESFDLTGFDPTVAQVSGQLAADNSVEVFLNGVDTGIGSATFNPLTAFTIGSGFQAGLNTLSFVVFNQDGPGPNPTGLRVEIDSATAGVPEPASFAFMGIGLAALGIFGRRLRS